MKHNKAMLTRLLASAVLLVLAASSAAKELPQLAIIIDDIGYNQALGARSVQLPGPYTLAILPFTPHAQSLAQQAADNGKELMLHVPMSNINNNALGPGALTNDMPFKDFSQTLRQAIDSIPSIVGVNNHMGSQLTQQARPMGWLMTELSRQNLYFIDSRTSADSLAWDMAGYHGVPTRKRDVFLDHQRDTDKIQAELTRAIALAKVQGSAVAIGHPFPETLAVLEAVGSHWQALGVELVAASALLQQIVSGAGHCPAPPPLLRQNASPATADYAETTFSKLRIIK
ncbi:MAG TPA: divergent polysaccharide deacetylase family protein [Cellvibrionaceae bacterium]